MKDKKSFADIADNWRTRAGENGIKVRPSEESQFADDEGTHICALIDGLSTDLCDPSCSQEMTMVTTMAPASFLSTKVGFVPPWYLPLAEHTRIEALLPAPFLSSQRRARAFTQIQPQVISSPLAQIPNPQLSTPARTSHGQSFAFSPALLNTPPPNAALLNKYRMRGAATDPAHTRRRPAFGQVSSNRCYLRLRFSRALVLSQTSELCDIEEDEYAPLPPAFAASNAAHIQSQTLPLHLHDPFDNSVLSERAYFDAHSFSSFPEIPKAADPPPSCSVCGARKGSLAVLEPCAHPLCSGCLTSALNIVGEKDMECAVCKSKVDDFKLSKVDSNFSCAPAPARMDIDDDSSNDSFCIPSDGGFQDFFDRAQGASTPVPRSRTTDRGSTVEERVVLRIDNVPWVGSRAPIISAIVIDPGFVGHHPARYCGLAQAPCRTSACAP